MSSQTEKYADPVTQPDQPRAAGSALVAPFASEIFRRAYAAARIEMKAVHKLMQARIWCSAGAPVVYEERLTLIELLDYPQQFGIYLQQPS